MPPSSSGSKNRPSKKSSGNSAFCLLHVGFLLALFFNPQDEGSMVTRNVIWVSADYTAI
jgi:hypothetical protein